MSRGAPGAVRGPALALALALSLAGGCSGLPEAALPGLPGAPPAPPATSPPAGPTYPEVEARVHELINRHRASRRLAPLASDAAVAAVARRHSEQMAAGRTPFGHDGFDSRAAEIRRVQTFRAMAENVAYDSRTPAAERLVASWLASPGHLSNIEGQFQVSGVGVARSPDGLYYATQIFLRTQ